MKAYKDPPILDFKIKDHTLFLFGSLSINNAPALLTQVEIPPKQEKGSKFIIDLSGLEKIDSAGVITLYHLQEQGHRKDTLVEITGPSSSIAEKLKLFKPKQFSKTIRPLKTNPFFELGDKSIRFIREYVIQFSFFMADVLYWSVTDLFNSRQRRKGEFIHQAINIGVNAVPIIVALSFIIGLVLALQSAQKISYFGANIYIVDLTVIAMMAEMGPLITAILVAGRSGSAIAAEIATMQVTSEIDALKTMGINPLRFLVVPRVYGSLITLPFLTVLAGVAGIAGGATVALTYLDITPTIFLNRMPQVLYQKDILTGIIKSFAYALIIVITGSFLGFQAERGAAGVGNVTTKSVVASITLVIIADSILGLIFY